MAPIYTDLTKFHGLPGLRIKGAVQISLFQSWDYEGEPAISLYVRNSDGDCCGFHLDSDCQKIFEVAQKYFGETALNPGLVGKMQGWLIAARTNDRFSAMSKTEKLKLKAIQILLSAQFLYQQSLLTMRDLRFSPWRTSRNQTIH